MLADFEKAWAHVETAVVGVVLIALTFWVARCTASKDAVTAERVKVLTHEVKVVDTLYRTDTLRAVRTKTHYDSVRVQDTVMRHDSVFVYRPAADTAITSCTEARHDCERIHALNDSLIVLLGKQKKHWTDRVGLSVGPSIVATKDGTVVWGVGVVLGVKVWP